MDGAPLRDAQPVIAQIAAMQTAVLNIWLLEFAKGRAGQSPAPSDDVLEVLFLRTQPSRPTHQVQRESPHRDCTENHCRHCPMPPKSVFEKNSTNLINAG